jgi:hypothetical protein
MRRLLSLALFAFVIVLVAGGHQIKESTISEPGVYQLSDLFNAADSVVLAKIVSGDTENYDVAIYKAEVLKSFKGVPVGDTIYFGPYVGERLGWEYVLFLRNTSNPISPKKPNAGYGTIHYTQIFNEGYSSMMTSYECTFSGKEIGQKCDYGVRVCTDYIKLPNTMLTSPPIPEETPFGCRFVRKNTFIAFLESLGSKGTGLNR